MAFCPKCGAQQDSSVRFCTKCGYDLMQDENESRNSNYEFPFAPAGAGAQENPGSNPQPRYTPAPAPRPQELTANDLPHHLRPLGAWSYFGYSFLFSIPLVGFIMLIVFACGGAQNINLRNYARSYFCAFLILLILVVFVLIVLLASGSSLSVLDYLF